MITLVYAYFNNGSMLDLHLRTWSQYVRKDRWKAIIVDDCSKEDPAEPHLIDVGFPIELYRIHTDISWNQNGARNLAMHHAQGWCLMTDMDLLLTPRHANRLLKLERNPETYYIPKRVLHDDTPYHPHVNSYLLHADLFRKAGGYDESFAGYYGTDSTFRRRIALFGRRQEIDIPLVLYKREEIPDASTTQYGRKGTAFHISSNPVLNKRKRLGLPPIQPLNFEWSRVC